MGESAGCDSTTLYAFPTGDVTGGEVAADDAERQGLVAVPGRGRRVAQLKETGDGGEIEAGAKDDLDAFAQRQAPNPGDLVTQVRHGSGLEDGSGVECEGELVAGHGGASGRAAVQSDSVVAM